MRSTSARSRSVWPWICWPKGQAVGGRQVFLQQLGRTSNGGQRALQLVGQGPHGVLQVGMAVQPVPHGFHGAGQVTQLTRQHRGGLALAELHMLGIVAPGASPTRSPSR